MPRLVALQKREASVFIRHDCHGHSVFSLLHAVFYMLQSIDVLYFFLFNFYFV